MLQKNGSISSDAGTSNCSLSRGELFLVCVCVCVHVCGCVSGGGIGLERVGGWVGAHLQCGWVGVCACGVCALVFIHVVYVC